MATNRSLSAGLILLGMAGLAASQEKTDGLTDQQKRGHEIFLNSKKGAPCSTCHSLAGEGTAVGPDLINLGGVATAAGMRMAIMATQTAYVVEVKLANGEKFPAMKGKEEGKTAEYFDLTNTPPVRRAVNKVDIDHVANNSLWKHPPESSGYTDDELKDVIGYIRYISKRK